LAQSGRPVVGSGWVHSTERLATTDVITNQFSDRADPVGGGFLIGYKFAPWANNIIVSPFASFDFLNAPVNHTFPRWKLSRHNRELHGHRRCQDRSAAWRGYMALWHRGRERDE
jgi:hypothetical protein